MFALLFVWLCPLLPWLHPDCIFPEREGGTP